MRVSTCGIISALLTAACSAAEGQEGVPCAPENADAFIEAGVIAAEVSPARFRA